MGKALRDKSMKIKTPLTKPSAAEFTGETVRDGTEEKLVYKELKPWHERSEVRVVKDHEGAVVYHQDRSGRRLRPVTERVETIPTTDPQAWREFTLVDLGDGNVVKNFYFRQDPKVAAAQKAEVERKRKWDELMDKLDPDQILAALSESGSEPRRKGRGG
jgi:hypothetical protein